MCEDENSSNVNVSKKESFVGSTLTGFGLGQLVQFMFCQCPAHTLGTLVVKTGLLGGSVAGMLTGVHNTLTYQMVAPAVEYMRGEEYTGIHLGDEPRDGLSNEEYAHGLVDGAGKTAAYIIPAGFVANSLRRRRK